MKKVFKRVIPFALVVVMCLCVAVPAFATSTGYTVQGYIGNEFPERGAYYAVDGYVGFIQRVMCAYSETCRDYIVSGLAGKSYMDEQFGEKTKSAVKTFQAREGLNDDGIVGELTWKKIANYVLFMRTTTANYKQYAVNGDVVASVSNVGSSGITDTQSKWYYFKYHTLDNTYMYYNSSFEEIF